MFTIEVFKEWLTRQNQEEKFAFTSVLNCVGAKFVIDNQLGEYVSVNGKETIVKGWVAAPQWFTLMWHSLIKHKTQYTAPEILSYLDNLSICQTPVST